MFPTFTFYPVQTASSLFRLHIFANHVYALHNTVYLSNTNDKFNF